MSNLNILKDCFRKNNVISVFSYFYIQTNRVFVVYETGAVVVGYGGNKILDLLLDGYSKLDISGDTLYIIRGLDFIEFILSLAALSIDKITFTKDGDDWHLRFWNNVGVCIWIFDCVIKPKTETVFGFLDCDLDSAGEQFLDIDSGDTQFLVSGKGYNKGLSSSVLSSCKKCFKSLTYPEGVFLDQGDVYITDGNFVVKYKGDFDNCNNYLFTPPELDKILKDNCFKDEWLFIPFEFFKYLDNIDNIFVKNLKDVDGQVLIINLDKLKTKIYTANFRGINLGINFLKNFDFAEVSADNTCKISFDLGAVKRIVNFISGGLRIGLDKGKVVLLGEECEGIKEIIGVFNDNLSLFRNVKAEVGFDKVYLNLLLQGGKLSFSTIDKELRVQLNVSDRLCISMLGCLYIDNT